MNEQTIWTVIIKDNSSGAMSTVSFRYSHSAIDYVLFELSDALEFECPEDESSARDVLEEQMYYEGKKATYWIEETRLF